MSIPGFSAERSLYRTKPIFRTIARHGFPVRSESVVPQRTNGGPHCGACSNLIVGTRWCCDGDPVTICWPEACGIAVDIVKTLGGIFLS